MTLAPEVGRHVQAAGIRTNYHDTGSGSAVLLLHGSGPGASAWSNWRLAMPALAERFRVIAPDQLGFGYTDRSPEGTYNMKSWVSHIVAFLDEVGLEKAHVVGNSFGGAVALRIAIEHPRLVDRLVVMGPVGVSFAITDELDMAWGYTPSLENMRKLLDAFAFDRSLVTDELAELRFRASTRPGVQEAFASMFPPPRQRWVDEMASPDAEIQGIRHQTLIVHGREDRIIPLSNSLKLLELIPRSQLHVFGQCGHWVQIEHAVRFNRLVADFFS